MTPCPRLHRAGAWCSLNAPMNASPWLCPKVPLTQFQGLPRARRPVILPQEPTFCSLSLLALLTANVLHNFRNHIHLHRIECGWRPQSWAAGSPGCLLEAPLWPLQAQPPVLADQTRVFHICLSIVHSLASATVLRNFSFMPLSQGCLGAISG